VSAIGILLIGIGAYLCYDAVKSSTPTPIANAKSALAKVSGGSSSSGSSSSGGTDAVPNNPQYGIGGVY
jgi:hypothetical protein